ncbi:MAG TPA: hypothetical protein VEG60_26710 [Candidatus Binatia bacterium]|nr:hypothetical protein [Candidatus Binatia bacterium]
MAESSRVDAGLFDGGPPLRMEKSLGLVEPDRQRDFQRAALVVLIVWAPLFVLAAIQSLVLGENKLSSLLVDFTVHFRFLIAAPLFVLAESFVLPRLGQIVRHFIDAGLVVAAERPRFDAIAQQTRRLLNSLLAEILVVIIAYLAAVLLLRVFPEENIPAWHKVGKDGFTWAGWWNVWVSIPISIVLFLGWIWRLFLWGLFLCRVARLNLRLVAAHPDLAGGLQFVGASVRTFVPLAFALSAVVAGGVTERVSRMGASLFGFKFVIGALVVVLFIMFVGPILVFTGKLIEARRKGILEYGGLAGAVGRQLEKRWVQQLKDVDEKALDVQHFSATTDLYQVVSNVYQMKAVPLDVQDLIAMIVMILLPFLPALLFEIPLNEILADLVKVIM